MPRLILLANEAMHLCARLDPHQIAHLKPTASVPIVPLRGRVEFKLQAPAKDRAIARRQERQAKASITGRGKFTATYGD